MSNGVGGIKERHHFTADDEAELRKDETTSSIVKRDTKGADISGTDKTWRDTKKEQQGHHGPVDALSMAHTTYEAFEIAELAPSVGAAGPIVGAVGGFALGVHELYEAHKKADEQALALNRDTSHVALIGALDLPGAYKAKRFDGDYKHVGKENGSPAFKATESLRADTRGLAKLQLHADRGMNAARDMQGAGMTKEAYFKTNPKAAEAYAADAAFREGFDAFVYVKENAPLAERGKNAANDMMAAGVSKEAYLATHKKERDLYMSDPAFREGFNAAIEKRPNDFETFTTKLNERDGWYAQSQIAYRV